MKRALFLLCLTAVLTACRATRETPPKTSDALHVTIPAIHNAMPSADDPPVVRKPYLIINICPQENVLRENIRLISLTAHGTGGQWTTTAFDRKNHYGKGAFEYENVARDFDPGFAPPYTFDIIVETASGNVKTIEVTNMQTMVVY